jgi:two-component sensor histidine kinase
MTLHELATNAAKYGALSNAAGRVSLEWRREPADGMTLTWRESGGPPVKEPTRKGFGSRLIANGFKADGGATDIAFNEAGLTCTIRCVLPAA